MRTPERAALAVIVLLAAVAAVAHFADWAPLPTFAIATVALAGMAWIVSFATEQVGGHIGTAATGLLQATLGNLPELFVVLFALRAGERAVAQSAIVGSLFATALLVLGLVLVVGAVRAPGGIMRFNPKVARDTATLLLVCVFIIVIVGLALGARRATPRGGDLRGGGRAVAERLHRLGDSVHPIGPVPRGGERRDAAAGAPRLARAAGRRRRRRRFRLRLVRRRASPRYPTSSVSRRPSPAS